MRIVLAITDPQVVYDYFDAVGDRSLGPVSLLVSLPYADGVIPGIRELVTGELVDFVMFDAGTYTLNKGGRFTGMTHRFEEYMDFVQAHGDLANIIASYDIDFRDPDRNQDMYRRMLWQLDGSDLRKKIMPVVHAADAAAAEFQYYLECGATYIGIGSKPALPKDQWGQINRLRFWHDVWTHIFGTLEMGYIKDKMPDSVDTARYAIDAAYGGVFYWSDARHEFVRMHLGKDADITDEFRAYAGETFGYTRADLLAKPMRRWIVNIHSIQRMEKYLNEVWYCEHGLVV